MTAFELCRRHPELELAPVLRIVKYLGLDSGSLGEPEVERIRSLHTHFRHDPELIVGRAAIAERAGIEPERLASLLEERRQEIPFLGTPERPMIPAVALGMLRRAAAGAGSLLESGNGVDGPAPSGQRTGKRPVDGDLKARLGRLERELEAALEQVRGIGRSLSRIDGEVPLGRPRREPRRRHRRSGGGKPDTIVEACRTVLAESDAPMKVADITERVISRGVEIRAKNPNVTVSSILSSYEAFERVRRGYYTLAPGTLTD